MNNHTFMLYKLFSSRNLKVIAAVGLLAVFTYILHGSALDGHWRFDDPWLLMYVSDSPQPSDFFFSPSHWQSLGAPFFTPWLTLEYWFDLSLFGLDPRMFYAHHLLMIWLASSLTFVLLQRYAGAFWSLTASTLFLASAPTAVIAHQLMSRHYVTGLVFTILAILLWFRAREENNNSVLMLASLSYLLAMLNKEIYAPLPLVLFFLGGETLRSRIRAISPFAVIALCYILWRSIMLGEVVGGYHGFQAIHRLIDSLTGFSEVWFGSTWLNWLAKSLLILTGLILFQESKYRLPLAAAFIALMLPFIAISVSTHPTDFRFTFLPWWGICIMMAKSASRFTQIEKDGSNTVSVRNLPIAMISVLVIATTIYKKERESTIAYKYIADQFDAISQFIWAHDQTLAYIPPQAVATTTNFTYPLSVLKEQTLHKSAPIPIPFADTGSLLTPNLPIQSYDMHCNCMKTLPSKATNPSISYIQTIRLDRIRGGIAWDIQHTGGGACFLYFLNIKTSLAIPCSGEIFFNIPNWIKGNIRIVTISPDNRWSITPELAFPENGYVLSWSYSTSN